MEHEAFALHADGLHLSAGAVAGLLVVRAVLLGRLPAEQGKPPLNKRRSRLTAAVQYGRTLDVFNALAERQGTGPEAALRSLIRVELETGVFARLLESS